MPVAEKQHVLRGQHRRGAQQHPRRTRGDLFDRLSGGGARNDPVLEDGPVMADFGSDVLGRASFVRTRRGF